MSRQISRSRSRLFGLFGLFGRVETKLRFLDLDRDFLISTEISRSLRLTFENRRDYPSRRD
jgi:hypothetical protein